MHDTYDYCRMHSIVQVNGGFVTSRCFGSPPERMQKDRERDISVTTAEDTRRSRTGGGNGAASNQILTCDEVAEYLRVHVGSVRRWSRSGKLTAFKVGGRGDWRYREQDVLAFLYDATTDGKGQEGVMSYATSSRFNVQPALPRAGC
jgi:excisionase family DNA binding protein